MAATTAQAVKELRDMTGLGMMECKKILSEADGDIGKAKDMARKRGQEKVAKLAARSASEGIIEVYIHHNSKVGVLIELNCNTDFVARNETFRQLARDLAMHIAALSPQCVTREELDQEVVKGIREHHAKDVPQGKPAEVIEKIVDGKMRVWFEERVLLDQKFAKDDSKTIRQLLEDATSQTGENVTVARFVRFEVGETAPKEPEEGAED
ncbi:Elongation factor Ts [Planctomycetes bacterium Pan216]|uniref:Elongation factor Ts n=1 Tax=Kolteria novifilia TaxID=2527975 RepID=A0A518B090_9BACT|nr:Elongation factor Ts [Planctomycetes bacterium Pan216]